MLPNKNDAPRTEFPETCSLCGKVYNTYDSPMLKNDVWERISNEHFDEDGKWITQHICLECMEKRLGRKIVEDDLMMTTDIDGKPEHVIWNTTRGFVYKHFPNHKYQTFEMRHPELIREYIRAYNREK